MLGSSSSSPTGAGDAPVNQNESVMDLEGLSVGGDEEGILDQTMETVENDNVDDLELDCYPYTFSPLLLFEAGSYFDKGLSNYNAVAQFFSPVLCYDDDKISDDDDKISDDFEKVDMLRNVLYDSNNMKYEELLSHIIDNEMIVTCCIDAHFTAFKMFKDGKRVRLLYYDPLQPSLQLAENDDAKRFALFKLMKCKYGDGAHIQDNKDYYHNGSPLRRDIWKLWARINLSDYVNARLRPVSLELDQYLLFNDESDPTKMSTQRTGNTCYFQTYLFCVFSKVGRISVATSGKSVRVAHSDRLATVAERLCSFLLEFFVQETDTGTLVMRPLTNCNLVLDFYRYRSAPYYACVKNFLEKSLGRPISDEVYERQYHQVLQYYHETKCLHQFDKFVPGSAVASSPNTKSLQVVAAAEGAEQKIARSDYYKYRAVNFTFGLNSITMKELTCFCQFNSLRKNQLLQCYSGEEIFRKTVRSIFQYMQTDGPIKCRDYYFMPQYEVGQKELVALHHYTYLIDLVSLLSSDELGDKANDLRNAVMKVNREFLLEKCNFSTSKPHSYQKIIKTSEYLKSSSHKRSNFLLREFMSPIFFQEYTAHGFGDFDTRVKEFSPLTQTVLYESELMRQVAHRQEFDFEKECISNMARNYQRRYDPRFDGNIGYGEKYQMNIKIGLGHTYSKYNTLMHFLNVVQSYWRNPDLNNIQIFGKDIRSLVATCSQKIFFDKKHTSGSYHYGPLEFQSGTRRYYGYNSSYSEEFDLAVSSHIRHAAPSVARAQPKKMHSFVVTDRCYEFSYLKGLVESVFQKANGAKLKTDNEVINLCLLSLLLDFGLFEQHGSLLNLPLLKELQHQSDTKELQVEVASYLYNFDRKNSADSMTRSLVEELLFETGHKFLVNKCMSVQSREFKIIRALNSDPDYQSYVLFCKIYMSLCQINKSVEVDYLKLKINGGEHRVVIPSNFSKFTRDYIEQTCKNYTFTESGDGILRYDGHPMFDLRPHQPRIDLFQVRLESSSKVQSMTKYVEMKNVFRVLSSDTSREQYVIFIADNALFVDVRDQSQMTIRLNSNVAISFHCLYFNDAISFIPCFKYVDGEDVVVFTSRNLNPHVDNGGQFATDYYGMRCELMEVIESTESYMDLNDDHKFKEWRLSELVTESKTIFHFPDYLLQVTSRQQLINLLDMAIHLRNIGFTILVLMYLERCSIDLKYYERENNVVKISGPWKNAISYALDFNQGRNEHYDSILRPQFTDLDQYRDTPLDDFVDKLCEHFTRYQRFVDGSYQIVPTEKQKTFLKRLLCAEESFHFSEVGSGKTKVILPLLCQTFLSNNAEAHEHLRRGGKRKDTLIVLVPEHLVNDAKNQVYRYCLNVNFASDYRVYDDIFALKHDNVQFSSCNMYRRQRRRISKQIFVTSFNQLKKALTDDEICKKIRPHREHILVVADEVDDFLDRDKLVFNICSNKNSSFEKSTLDLFLGTCCAAYGNGTDWPDPIVESSSNPSYWNELYTKFCAIYQEIQDASRSINKNFGIFNEESLRHCTSNITHDVEGYKSLIARPYESVNRAMPGSYFADSERTIFLTYVILSEDIGKYNELFQAERKFISYDYWSERFMHFLDFDDLVYGHEKLSDICIKHSGIKDGLIGFLFEIILRKMEIRDRSRSCNSIDVVFNFDTIGFTGTPFIDNYPTAEYIRRGRRDDIPEMIDRSFYTYMSENLPTSEFERRFSVFQGQNDNVMVRYVSSDFIRSSKDEMSTLKAIFSQEEGGVRSGTSTSSGTPSFNAIVDLCGIFKRSTISDVCNLIRSFFGPDAFQYVYHIDQADNSDRVVCLKTDNDIHYDEELYENLRKTHGEGLRDKIFFFVDNRNVIGKDIPMQLIYQKQFSKPLFRKSVVLAHDVSDFSKIWQAMGRSRTMSATEFAIYKSDVPKSMLQESEKGAKDIKSLALTRQLYISNCDRKVAGNISSIYLTLIALFNLANGSFYFNDKIENVFLDKMEMTIDSKVRQHESELVSSILGQVVPCGILQHILMAKLSKSSNAIVSQEASSLMSKEKLKMLLCEIVRQKYEQRPASGDIFDELILFLSGEQKNLMEISYTKQHQKQKQKQHNKNQDSDAMGLFDKKNQLPLEVKSSNYFKDTRSSESDKVKQRLNMTLPIPIFSIAYCRTGTGIATNSVINVYPTLQFLYSHHIAGDYITDEVKEYIQTHRKSSSEDQTSNFLHAVMCEKESSSNGKDDPSCYASSSNEPTASLRIRVLINHVRQNPQYTIAAISPGVYVIGTKDQFNSYDLSSFLLLGERIKYIVDEAGFVLYDETASKSLDQFGPYFIEQYIIMEYLSKQEVAQNVLDHYCNSKEMLELGLRSYNEKQGKGFICWRFLINESAKAAAAAKLEGTSSADMETEDKEMEVERASNKKMRRNDTCDSSAC